MTDIDGGGALAAPVTKSARIDSLDILRGVAVFGIFLMNISGFGLIWQAYANPFAAGGSSGLDLTLFQIMNVGFEGTMRGIFSLLFGAGIVLMTERMEKSGAGLTTAEIHFRRMTWLLLFGFIHWALLLWSGEILFQYAISGFVLFAVRKLAAKWQLLAGLALLVTAALYQNVRIADITQMSRDAAAAEAIEKAGGKLDEEQRVAIEGWTHQQEYTIPSADSTKRYLEWHSGSYWGAVTGQYGESYDSQWANVPRSLMLDIIPFMLIGMAFLKFGILLADRSARFYAAMLCIGYAVGLTLQIHEYNMANAGNFERLAMLDANRTYQISRFAMVCGHLGLLLLAIKFGIGRWFQRCFAAAGQMALSNYIAQSILCMFLFYGFGFGLYNELSRSQLYTIVVVVMVVELAWSVVWMRNFRFGPLEWLWRSLTYWKLQPMRLDSTASTPPSGQMLGAT